MEELCYAETRLPGVQIVEKAHAQRQVGKTARGGGGGEPDVAPPPTRRGAPHFCIQTSGTRLRHSIKFEKNISNYSKLNKF